MLATVEPLGVVVEDFGAVQKLFEGDLVEESCIRSTSIPLNDLGVQMSVLCCPGDGSAWPPYDVPGQRAAQPRHLNRSVGIGGYRRMAYRWCDIAVEPVDETCDVGVDGEWPV